MLRRDMRFGRGGRDRTRADAVLETAALPLSYAGMDDLKNTGDIERPHLSDL
jgi:hypothetical protein